MVKKKGGNILVTGGGGMVGSLVNFGIRLNHKQLDVCNIKAIKKSLDTYKPSVVLHLAALGMALCQKYPDKAYEANILGTLNIAKVCKEKKIKLVFLSSCTIFDGAKKTPYNEDDLPYPIHIYGETKIIGESIILNMIPNSLVIRTGWLFGNRNIDKGFISNCLNKLKQGEDFIINTPERVGSPTYIPDLLKEIQWLIDQDAKGIYHVVNAGKASYFEIGEKIKKIGNFKSRIEKARIKNTKSEIPNRGKMEALTSKKIKLRPWQKALAEYLRKN